MLNFRFYHPDFFKLSILYGKNVTLVIYSGIKDINWGISVIISFSYQLYYTKDISRHAGTIIAIGFEKKSHGTLNCNPKPKKIIKQQET
jgi:hypothetical protein